jgi:hypothetical protein
MALVGPPLEYLVVDKPLQPRREDVVSDAGGPEVLIAARAEERVANDQQSPPLADDVKRAGDRAGHLGKARLLHDTNDKRGTCIMQVALLGLL